MNMNEDPHDPGIAGDISKLQLATPAELESIFDDAKAKHTQSFELGRAPSLRILCDDARGKIISIAERADVIKITSKMGARRANHYHKEFGHWCLVVYGCIEYWERKVGATDKPHVVKYYTGDLFWTGPMVEHLMLFPYDALTQFYCFSVGARGRESYETDTVRMDFKLDDQ